MHCTIPRLRLSPNRRRGGYHPPENYRHALSSRLSSKHPSYILIKSFGDKHSEIIHHSSFIIHHSLAPAATAFVQTHLTEYRTLFRFFLEKRRNQKRLQGLKYRPRSLPANDVLVTRAAVCDFLPLCHRDEMWMDDGHSLISRTHAIGHRGVGVRFNFTPWREVLFLDKIASPFGRGVTALCEANVLVTEREKHMHCTIPTATRYTLPIYIRSASHH